MRPIVAMDTETNIHLFPGRPKIACLTVDPDGSRNEIFDRDSAKDVFRWAVDKGNTVVWTNAAFDLTTLCTNFPELFPVVTQALERGQIRCTRIISLLRAIATGDAERDGQSHSLATCVLSYFGETITGKSGPDVWRLRYGELLDVPISEWPLEAIRYAKMDATWTRRVFMAQLSERLECDGQQMPVVYVDGETWWPSEQLSVAHHFYAYWSSLHGFRRDFGFARGLTALLQPEADKVWAHLRGQGLAVPNKKQASGHSKVKRAMQQRVYDAYAAMGEDVPRNKASDTTRAQRDWLDTEEEPSDKKKKKAYQKKYERLTTTEHLWWPGEVKTDQKTLLRSGDEDLITFGSDGSVLKVMSTYLPSLLKRAYLLDDDKTIEWRATLSPNYSPIMKTGRVSVSGEAALQQFPQAFGPRECLTARPGNALVMTDLKAAESVGLSEVYCVLLGVETWELPELLRSGKDHHLWTGLSIARIWDPARWADATYEEFASAFDAGDPDVKKYRKMAKPVNHGGAGGMGAAAFRDSAYGYGVKLTLAEAEQVLLAWRQAFPSIEKYFKYITKKRDVWDGGIAITQPGTGRVRSGMSYTSACNTPFQGITGDGKKAAVCMVVREEWEAGSYDDDCTWHPGTPSALYGTRHILDMHDELITECPIRDVDAVAKRQEHLLVLGARSMMKHCRDLVAADSVATVRWSKAAKAIYRDNKLQVWYGPRPECALCVKPTIECPACWQAALRGE